MKERGDVCISWEKNTHHSLKKTSKAVEGKQIHHCSKFKTITFSLLPKRKVITESSYNTDKKNNAIKIHRPDITVANNFLAF